MYKLLVTHPAASFELNRFMWSFMTWWNWLVKVNIHCLNDRYKDESISKTYLWNVSDTKWKKQIVEIEIFDLYIKFFVLQNLGEFGGDSIERRPKLYLISVFSNELSKFDNSLICLSENLRICHLFRLVVVAYFRFYVLETYVQS